MSDRKPKLDQKELFDFLAKDFHELVSNKPLLQSAVETFLDNLIDEITLGVIFDLHRKYKTKAIALEVDESVDEVETDFDVFTQHNPKKNQECVCPSCDRAVAATRFGNHLETCMGLGRVSRNASRRAVTNIKDSVSYGGMTSDDDDDSDWNSAEQRKKKRDKNGSKKKGTPKKNNEASSELVDSINIDIEGEDEELTNLRDILRLQDHSNSTSPADSASSSGSTKKREKSKSKKSTKRDKRTPSPGSA